MLASEPGTYPSRRRGIMQFAIAIPTDADSWWVVRRAEELGFSAPGSTTRRC